jgi:hypothetical protein
VSGSLSLMATKLPVGDTPGTALIASNSAYVANNLVIPDIVTDRGALYYITSIAEEAFYGCSGLTNGITINDSMESIGKGAFYNCTNIIDATFGANNKISKDTNNVYYLKNDTVYYCLGKYSNVVSSGIEPTGSLTLQSGTKIICGEAFESCSSLTGNFIIPDLVTNINEKAFACWGAPETIGSLTIGQSVKVIDR